MRSGRWCAKKRIIEHQEEQQIKKTCCCCYCCCLISLVYCPNRISDDCKTVKNRENMIAPMILLLSLLVAVNAFRPITPTPHFKNPKILTSKEIFTEKQYRQFIATYSVDERFNFIDWIKGFFNKSNEEKEEEEGNSNEPGYANSLKKTVSLSVLEEKTALFVKGKADAKTYLAVLTAAFGAKLDIVLPEILANLPEDKAQALSKLTAKTA
eukprot:scaffold644_cov168-Ochromonas_danica.AAC.15